MKYVLGKLMYTLMQCSMSAVDKHEDQ